MLEDTAERAPVQPDIWDGAVLELLQIFEAESEAQMSTSSTAGAAALALETPMPGLGPESRAGIDVPLSRGKQVDPFERESSAADNLWVVAVTAGADAVGALGHVDKRGNCPLGGASSSILPLTTLGLGSGPIASESPYSDKLVCLKTSGKVTRESNSAITYKGWPFNNDKHYLNRSNTV